MLIILPLVQQVSLCPLFLLKLLSTAAVALEDLCLIMISPGNGHIVVIYKEIIDEIKTNHITVYCTLSEIWV